MPNKKIVRKPIEKLSQQEQVVEIEDSSSDESSSDEEEYIAPVMPVVANPPPKSVNKVECDICGKMFSKGGIRLHRISCQKKHTKQTSPASPISLTSGAAIVEEVDKPMTMRQYKKMMAAASSVSAPPAKKPRKPYTRKPRPAPTPPPSPTPPLPKYSAPAEMMFV